MTMESRRADLAELTTLSTEDLRQRAFALAVKRRDAGFFWSLFRHLPHADDTEELDASLGALGASIDDAVAMWREFTGRGLGESEPLLRAAHESLKAHPQAASAALAKRRAAVAERLAEVADALGKPAEAAK